MGGIMTRIRSENSRSEGRSLRRLRPFMRSDEAIAEIRRLRPESIETEVQEEFVREYAEHLWRVAMDEEDGVDDENRIFDITGIVTAPIRKGAPKYILLMGLPGSGKSTVGFLLSK